MGFKWEESAAPDYTWSSGFMDWVLLGVSMVIEKDPLKKLPNCVTIARQLFVGLGL